MSQMLTQQGAERLQQFSTAMAESYGIPVNALARQFSITGPIETDLRAALLESAEFLSLITVMDVDQIKGQVIQTGIGQLYTGRKQDGRFKKKIGVKGNTYELSETDSCAVLDWTTLCVWANAGSEDEFIELVSQFITRSFALDMIRVGWNGVKVSDDTDPFKYPLGEDVNVGWHQLVIDWNDGSQIVRPDQGQYIFFDPDGNGDYTTLDQMASDIINTTIDPLFRNDPRLVVLVGADLVAAAQAKIYGEATKPTEQIAAQHLEKSIAGRPAMIPPFFPGKRMVVTTLDNLHLYTQRNTRKRKADDNQDAKGFENQYWRMEGYAIGEYLAYGAVDENDIAIAPRPPLPKAKE